MKPPRARFSCALHVFGLLITASAVRAEALHFVRGDANSDGKIDTSVKRIPAYYMRAISASSLKNAKNAATDSKYLKPPKALVDSVKADVKRVKRG